MAARSFNPGGGVKPDKRAGSLNSIRALIRSGALAEAEAEGKRHLLKHKKDGDALYLLAAVAERRFRIDEAKDYVTRALAIGGGKGISGKERFDATMILFRLERHAGNTDAALGLLDQAAAMKPGQAGLEIQRAGTLEEAGRYDEARGVVEPLIEAFERLGKGMPSELRYELGKLLVHAKDYDTALSVIDGALGESSTPQEMAMVLNYLRAKACDRAGNYEAAFDAATAASEIGRLEFDPALAEEQVTALMAHWSPERVAKFPRSSCEDELPVFIAGMPRSGTSLIDQIIDAHPLASGVGENAMIEEFSRAMAEGYDEAKEPPACFGRFDSYRWTATANAYCKAMRRIAPAGTERVVNKALGNNKMVGLLGQLFPKTRVIHSMRDPRDVAISCYMGWFNNQMHAWSTRIEWVSIAWSQSQRLMEFWKETLDVPILDISYEDLVRDPQTHFPKLIEFIGLEWDPACLDFYKSKRTVRTLSYDQVNRPLYTSSAGRHANYLEQLKGVDFPEYSPSGSTG